MNGYPLIIYFPVLLKKSLKCMVDAADYSREVCIDKPFNSNGTIKQVMPAYAGIKAIKLNK
jgi:hypothetical protein